MIKKIINSKLNKRLMLMIFFFSCKYFIINKKSKKTTKNDFYMIKINKEILSMEGLKWIYI